MFLVYQPNVSVLYGRLPTKSPLSVKITMLNEDYRDMLQALADEEVKFLPTIDCSDY